MIYLPEMIDKIKDTIEGLKGNWQDYGVHKAATPESENVHGLQDMIQTLTALFGAEYGKNTDGDWVRFNFGLQVCWNNFETIENVTPTAYTSGLGGLTAYHYDIIDIPFPKLFSSTPIVIPNANPNYSGDMETNCINKNPESCNIRVHSLSNFTSVHSLGYFAIGWWKTPDNPAEWSEE